MDAPSDSGRGEDLALRARIAELGRYFGVDHGSIPEAARPLLHEIMALRNLLWRPERQVTFFGALKAGKSTVINALTGTALLPARANRATGVVTRIRWSHQPTVAIMRPGEDGTLQVEEIGFHQLPGHILLDLSGNTPQAPNGITEVQVGIPLPLLQEGVVLVDTPGFLDDQTLTELGQAQLQRTDLAVMVIAADKLLATAERAAARTAHDLLNGNIAFLINRLDLVDDEDRAEVVDWARAALAGTGNPLIGKPRIFATAAKSSSPGGPSTKGDGVAEFRHWLTEIMRGPTGDRVAFLSRLGILHDRLTEAGVVFRRELEAAREERRQIEAEESAALERDRAEMQRAIATDRDALTSFRAELSRIEETFVQDCIRRTQESIRTHGGKGRVPVSFERALATYAASVTEGTRSALLRSHLPATDFQLQQWIVAAEVSPVTSPTTEIGAMLGEHVTWILDGGKTGKAVGTAIGDWLGKNLLRQDADQETMRAIERAARAVLPALRRETDHYLESVDRLLADADSFYQHWERIPPRLASIRETEQSWDHLATWCTTFRREVKEIGDAVAIGIC